MQDNRELAKLLLDRGSPVDAADVRPSSISCSDVADVANDVVCLLAATQTNGNTPLSILLELASRGYGEHVALIYYARQSRRRCQLAPLFVF